MIINGKNISILDCTLRDGGYYTNWDFPYSLVEKYLKAVNSLPIDYVELGYRSAETDSYHGQYDYLPDFVLKQCQQLCPDKKRAVMVNLKEVNQDNVSVLLGDISEYVDMIRFATRPNDIEKAIAIARIAKNQGLETAVNIMYMSTWVENPSFAELLGNADKYVDCVMMVDSYGSVYPEQIADCVKKLRMHYKGKIGFHGHNNLELAFANTRAAIEAGIDIVDATISGMGRGAGNLRMELMMTYCTRFDSSLSLNTMMETLEDFETLRHNYGWGTNLPYMISGCNSLPQKDIMEWITKKRYSAESIVRRLQAHIKQTESEFVCPVLCETADSETVTILIGGGESVIAHIDAIIEFIRRQTKNVNLIFSSSKHLYLFDSLPEDVDRYIYLVGIEGKRLEKHISSVRKSDRFVITPQSPNMSTYIPLNLDKQVYVLPLNYSTEMEKNMADSPLYVSIKIAMYLKAEEILLAGYDGYGTDAKSDKFDMMEENQSVVSFFAPQIRMLSLLPTKYHNLKELSVYFLLTK